MEADYEALKQHILIKYDELMAIETNLTKQIS
jgi:hypothetical protein